MKVEGAQTVAAPRQRVWELLTSPRSLAKLLPGCESLEETAEDTYSVRLKVAMGAVGGSYSGTVTLSEKREPEHLRLALKSRGSWGFAEGDGAFELAERGRETEVRYAGELKVGGMLAALGGRLIESAARRAVAQFFQQLAEGARQT